MIDKHTQVETSFTKKTVYNKNYFTKTEKGTYETINLIFLMYLFPSCRCFQACGLQGPARALSS